MPHGGGVATWGAGDHVTKYSGEWEDGAPHGAGKTSGDGGVGGGDYDGAYGGEYNGRWERGARHGLGTLVRADGTTYHGSFARGLPSGAARFPPSTRARLDGTFALGLAHGEGVERSWDPKEGTAASRADAAAAAAGAARYRGQYAAGLRHGKGSWHPDAGEWQDDLYVGEQVAGGRTARAR